MDPLLGPALFAAAAFAIIEALPDGWLRVSGGLLVIATGAAIVAQLLAL